MLLLLTSQLPVLKSNTSFALRQESCPTDGGLGGGGGGSGVGVGHSQVVQVKGVVEEGVDPHDGLQVAALPPLGAAPKAQGLIQLTHLTLEGMTMDGNKGHEH